jgi:hypothetical protein
VVHDRRLRDGASGPCRLLILIHRFCAIGWESRVL